MQEDYLISILGRQQVDRETGEVEVTTFGSYLKKGDSRYIVYKEYDEEVDGRPRTSVLKIEGDNKVTLMRGGSEGTRLILENGKRHLCRYDTGFGHMMVGVFTSRMRANLNDAGGRLEIGYTLDINSTLSSFNEITITVKEAENKDVKISAASDR